MSDRTDLQFYIDAANEMLDTYEELRRDQQKMDEVVRLKWALPAGMPSWARPFKTTIPYDAIKAGVRVLSALDPDISLDPYAFSENLVGDLTGAKDKANSWEVALKWQWGRAARRRANLLQDVVRSALMYDEIAAQIIHLPTQIKTIEKLGGTANRQKAALQYGNFAILLRNPQTVYTRYSDYMLEAVLYVTIKDPQSIMDFWNNSELGRLIEDGEAPDSWIHFDYVDYYRRVVFCYPGETVGQVAPMGTFNLEGKGELEIPAIELLNEPWKFDFLPWAIATGGTGLATDPANSRFPLLYGLIKSDQWNNTNILGSLALSEAIAEAARPDVARIGITPDSIEADYGEVGGTWDVPAGHDIKPMPQMQLDPALREGYDRGVADMSQTAIPRVLVTAEAGPDETFSGFNMRIQQAMASLLPPKLTAERFLVESHRLFLNWTKVSGKALEGPGGELIEPEEIDMNRIYLGVTLQQDVPLDKQARMATAIQASRDLKMPTKDVLEMLGDTNPERTVKEWMMEQMDMAYFNGVLQHIQFQASQAIEQQMAQAQLQAQMQQAQSIIEQQAAAAAQAPAPGQPQGLGGGIEGAGFNPAQGGIPPAMAAPGATREAQTGLTATGEEVLA